MRLVYDQLKEYRRDAALTLLFASVQVIGMLLLPFIIAKVIDNAQSFGQSSQIYFYGGIMLLLALVSMGAGFISAKTAANAATGLASNLREGIYGKIQEFSFSNIDKFSTSGLVTRLTTDVTNIQQAFQMTLLIASKSPLMIIFSMILAFMINPQISLLFFAAIILLALVLLTVAFLSIKIFAKVFSQYDSLNGNIQENISGIRVVKAYVREAFENEKFQTNLQKLYKVALKAESLLALNNPILMLTIYVCILGISWFGATFIAQGSMTTGELSSLFSYVMAIMMSLMMLSMIFTMIAMSLSNLRRISEVFVEEPSIKEIENPITTVEDGSIDFYHVNFSYSGDAELKTLKNVTLHISSGETIGIIGASGSGKSSFVSLINRLYDVDQGPGSVLVSGKDVRSYELDTLRKSVAVVLQKNVLFSGTILDNLRWGNETATEEECRAACQAACADEFIDGLPEGYQTHIERGGANVSGGQKQRLCIARALLSQPKILVMDDSTSAVDTATDAKIRTALADQLPDTTKIIVAQRIASVEDADRIIVLEDGQVTAYDSHKNLLHTNKFYRELNDLQKSAGGDFDLES